MKHGFGTAVGSVADRGRTCVALACAASVSESWRWKAKSLA